MKVKNLLDNDFYDACSHLASHIMADGYHPDFIVGIMNGGDYVGRCLFEQLRESFTIYTKLQLQREGSKQKSNGITSAILKLLPERICDILRMLEAKWLEYSSKKHKPKRLGNLYFDSEIIDVLKQGGKQILIVDDAVDTGTTLNKVLDYITQQFPNNTVKTAALTVTMSHPLVFPDYYLYNNHTLLRFPWSNDVKSKKCCK